MEPGVQRCDFEATVAVAKAEYSPNLASAALAPRIRTNVDLVLVPVSVTDGMQRLVTGLDQANFQVFEGKKSLPIKHFSSEDAPISVGILVDASGSMKNKMDRVQEAVNQFCEASNPGDEFFMITFSDVPHLASDFTSAPEDLQRELLFEHPKGHSIPVLANLFGTPHRVALGMGATDISELRGIGQLLANLREPEPPKSVKDAGKLWTMGKALWDMKPAVVRASMPML